MLTSIAFLKQLKDDNSDSESGSQSEGTLDDVTRDPVGLLKLLRIVANDKGRLLSTFTRPTSAPELQLAAGAIEDKKGNRRGKAKINFRPDGDPSTASLVLSGHSGACDHCGRHHSRNQRCRAMDDECNFCGKRGHWERRCRQKAKEGKKNGLSSEPAPQAAAATTGTTPSSTTLSSKDLSSIRTLRDLCREMANVSLGEEHEMPGW